MRIINGLASRKEIMEPYGGLKFSQLDQAEVTEDLKAFERRLTEYVGCIGPQTGKWRLILVMSSVWTLYTAWGWLTDSTQHKSFFQSMWYHIFFTISCCNLLFLFLIGIHRRVMAPQIILARTRLVLQDYNMSCDEKGRLILKPRPT